MLETVYEVWDPKGRDLPLVNIEGQPLIWTTDSIGRRTTTFYTQAFDTLRVNTILARHQLLRASDGVPYEISTQQQISKFKQATINSMCSIM
jgi:hypothetical protein